MQLLESTLDERALSEQQRFPWPRERHRYHRLGPPRCDIFNGQPHLIDRHDGSAPRSLRQRNAKVVAAAAKLNGTAEACLCSASFSQGRPRRLENTKRVLEGSRGRGDEGRRGTSITRRDYATGNISLCKETIPTQFQSNPLRTVLFQRMVVMRRASPGSVPLAPSPLVSDSCRWISAFGRRTTRHAPRIADRSNTMFNFSNFPPRSRPLINAALFGAPRRERSLH